MNIPGVCAVCGRTATEKCKMCGRGNCGRKECKIGFVCVHCARGKE